jgi:4-hydroxybenzoate polyprenyltransferase
MSSLIFIKKIKILNKLLLMEQTLFALPWVIVGMLFASIEKGVWLLDGMTTVYLLSAFIGARIAGMSINRLVDYPFDAKNPRTQDRPLPKGEITPKEVKMTTLCSLLLFVWASFQLSPFIIGCTPIIIALLFLYSYLKRWSVLCHFALGIIEFFAPFLGYIAVAGSLESSAPYFLGAAIFFWISGVDIAYATQDRAFDRKAGLKSIPAVFGFKKSLILSRICHLMMTLSLLGAAFVVEMGWIYYVGLSYVAILLFYQQSKIEHVVQKGFFIANAQVALILMVFTFGAWVWRG